MAICQGGAAGSGIATQLNHLKIYMKDGSQIRMMGVDTRNGFKDGTETCGDSQAGKSVSRRGEEKEIKNTGYDGTGHRVQRLLCWLASAPLGTKVSGGD